MKAIMIRNYGGPEVLKLEDIPRPSADKGEILIKVHAASINPVDSWIRSGGNSHFIPFVPGWDVSGVVEEIGSEVSRFKYGDAVYARLDISKNGAFAEYTVVSESDVALKPTSIDHVLAAAIPIAGQTAWQGLFDWGNLQPNQTVLIHGASGGVGRVAVQLAKWKGARVIATASGCNQDFLREMGIDEPINYEKQKFEEIAKDVDLVFDTVGGETQRRSWAVIKKGGTLFSLVGLPSMVQGLMSGVRSKYFAAHADATQLKEIARLVDSGAIKVFVDTVVSLESARETIEGIESGRIKGKVILRVINK